MNAQSLEQQINIQVNGEMMQLPAQCTVLMLIEQLELTGTRIAVEVNLNIIPKSEHQSTLLNVGDTVEVVHAIGGG